MSNKKLKSDPLGTVLTITVGFLAIYLITYYNTQKQHVWMLIVSVSVGLLGLVSVYIRKKIDFLWMKLSWVLSFIMPNILLSVVYYIFLFPLALLSRAFGKKDPLYLKNKYKSTYREVNRTYDKPSFEKPW